MISINMILVIIFFAMESNALLYDKNDNVTIFTKDSFASTFDNIPNDNWFIQFYNPYCGHCVNFAPIFKSFVREAKYWNWIINFGVVDCNAEDKLCNDQSVQYYPFFKIFPKNGIKNASSHGSVVKFSHRSLDEVYQNVIELVEQFVDPSSSLSHRNATNAKRPPYLLLITGKIVDAKRTFLAYSNRLKYKLYYKIIDNLQEYRLKLVKESIMESFSYKDLTELYNGLDGHLKKDIPKKEIQTHKKFTTVNFNSAIKRTFTFSTIYPVYNQDMYASIMYAFLKDVNDQKLNTVANVRILKNFIIQLYQFSGFNDNLLLSFRHIIKALGDKAESLEERRKFPTSWTSIVKSANFPSMEYEWVGCNGSQPHFRRYPCGMWTMFHILSINQYLKSQTNLAISENSINLIKAIREFIVTFFSCVDCAENFEKETEDYRLEVTDTKSAVMYIWKIHNIVNKRLAKQPSEDPQFPKIAFPSQSICPDCRYPPNVSWPNMIQWNRDNVFDYLIRHYSNINVVHFQTRTSLLITNSTWLSINLSTVEISMCVLLSVFSSFVVLLVFLKYLRECLTSKKRKFRRLAV